ncbi:DUF5753 domain-containing protein [Streptomyces sp. NBC_00846]|uniref:DUF5753 domain-containing protein n=1 Tax=Streptomyces sp. NBC_00846 TaxID=2975849 RepID=UPI00386EF103|nr:DUF5753 domain-containing protein [Streptomyces sp. NBC_00846]
MEAGRVGVSAERVRHLANQYTCSDIPLVNALVNMATERERGWWDAYRGKVPSGYLDLAELEHHATYVKTFESVHVPGLLQTEQQIRAIFSATVPRLSSDELETRVRFRLRRQEAVVDGRIGHYEAVIHEAALRIRVADRDVARSQLLHILDRSDLPHVTVRVIPFDVDGFAGMGDPLVYAGGPVQALDTVLMDTPHGGAFLDAEAQVVRYREVMRKLEVLALCDVESKDFIHRLLRSS